MSRGAEKRSAERRTGRVESEAPPRAASPAPAGRGDPLTSPRAALAYVAVVGATLLFERIGWPPLALVAALLFVPYLAEWGVHEPLPRRPLWWASQVIAGSALALVVGLARAAEERYGPWNLASTVLLAPLWPILVPRWFLLVPYAVAELASKHAYPAAALLTPLYGHVLHRLRMQGFERRRRRMLAVRRTIGAAVRSHSIASGAARDEDEGPRPPGRAPEDGLLEQPVEGDRGP